MYVKKNQVLIKNHTWNIYIQSLHIVGAGELFRVRSCIRFYLFIVYYKTACVMGSMHHHTTAKFIILVLMCLFFKPCYCIYRYYASARLNTIRELWMNSAQLCIYTCLGIRYLPERCWIIIDSYLVWLSIVHDLGDNYHIIQWL